MDIHLSDGAAYRQSIVTHDGTTLFMLRRKHSRERQLGIIGDADGFSQRADSSQGVSLYPLTAENAAAVRRRLPWLNPAPLGMQPSFGFGDRLGLATPGHVDSLRAADPTGSLAPVFAQQSVRENARTGRTAQTVVDDATWGLFQQGWRSAWAADADHVKERSDLHAFIDAGYTYFTFDPSDHVDNAAQTDRLDALQAKTTAIPWNTLHTSWDDLHARYARAPFDLDGWTLTFDEAILRRALAKYGFALANIVGLIQDLRARMPPGTYDLEISVDESDTPTSAHEHFFIITELARMGIHPTGLAPRFVGKFQKGVDYIGDLAEFERHLSEHARIQRHFGSYKLSIHTGSDKFKLYPLIERHTRGRVHVKTAGTSYLEALRIVATADPALFRSILDLGHRRFEEDRKTYDLDCDPAKVPSSAQATDADLPGLLDDFDARQLLHVSFGSSIEVYGAQLRALLTEHEEVYAASLQRHFALHLTPFVRGTHGPDRTDPAL